jgi:uncharacterized protein
MMIRLITGMTTLTLAMVLLAGCSRSPRVTFYTLNAAALSESAPQALESVVIGPVTVPDLLDRPQFVVTVDANRVDILEMHRWAAPLKGEIQRIIAADLALLLKPARVSVYPQNSGLDAVFRVQIDIQRFEMIEGKGVTVDLLWSIRRSDGGAVKNGRAAAHEPVTNGGYDTLVAAQSRALAAVSRDLATALRGMATAGDTLKRSPT